MNKTTVEPLYSRRHWDCSSVLIKKGVLISEVGLHRNAVVGILENVLIIEVSIFQSVPVIIEVPLYVYLD